MDQNDNGIGAQLADLKEMPLFLQALEGLDREETKMVKQALERKMTDINVSLHANEVFGSGNLTSIQNAKKYSVMKMGHVDRKLKAFNDRDREKAMLMYWMIYRGPDVGWVYSTSGPKEWLEKDCAHDPHAPLCEAVRITQQEYENRKNNLPYLEPR